MQPTPMPPSSHNYESVASDFASKAEGSQVSKGMQFDAIVDGKKISIFVHQKDLKALKNPDQMNAHLVKTAAKMLAAWDAAKITDGSVTRVDFDNKNKFTLISDTKDPVTLKTKKLAQAILHAESKAQDSEAIAKALNYDLKTDLKNQQKELKFQQREMKKEASFSNRNEVEMDEFGYGGSSIIEEQLPSAALPPPPFSMFEPTAEEEGVTLHPLESGEQPSMPEEAKSEERRAPPPYNQPLPATPSKVEVQEKEDEPPSRMAPRVTEEMRAKAKLQKSANLQPSDSLPSSPVTAEAADKAAADLRASTEKLQERLSPSSSPSSSYIKQDDFELALKQELEAAKEKQKLGLTLTGHEQIILRMDSR